MVPMPDPKFDPEERFSLHPLEGEEVVRRILDGEGTEEVSEEPEDTEEDGSS
jgi:hypothetical protein